MPRLPSTNNPIWHLLLFLTLHSSKIFVNGCSPIPPCGIKVENLKLTDIPGTLHVQVDKYDECEDALNFGGEVLSSVIVELNMETGEMRTGIDEDPFTTQQTDLDLFSVPTVDQNYRLFIAPGSEDVAVLREGYDDLTFTLPGFEFSDTSDPDENEGLVAFYSKKKDLFYFIYSVDGYNDNIAVCKTDGTCNISDFNLNHSLTRNSDEMAVYDSLNLVGLEVPCCLCLPTAYFVFDESGLTEFDILNAEFSPSVVDPRIGVAYSARNLRIISETLPYFLKTIPDEQSLDKAKLEEALNTYV